VTRSKELRRIQRAIEHRDERELQWALAQCALRKQFGGGGSHWYHLEKDIRRTLESIDKKD
jgi:hypothetical protein